MQQGTPQRHAEDLMRIQILQIAAQTRQRPLPRFDPQLGTLITLLRQRGHELALVGVARFHEPSIKAALARDLPHLIYADVAPVCVDVARRTLEFISAREFLPVVAGGGYPTVDPPASLSLPGVHAVAIGEPDASLVTYLERLKDPAGAQAVRGVWLRDEAGLTRPEMPALVEDLDSLPFAERDLFGYAEHVQRGGDLEIAAGRGCPQQCGYCLNDWVEALYEDRGTWVRRRSPRSILDEITLLRERYPGAKRVRILDHAFVLDTRWLESFAAAYAAGCELPLRCHVRANAMNEQVVGALATARCTWADVEVISGSDFIRNEMFDMELSNEQIRAAFAALRSVGIRIRATLYLGAPYESEASLMDTRQLLHDLRPDVVDARPYYPFPGTRSVEVCRNNGWLHPRGEEQYHHDHCGISMPACRPEVVEAFLRRLRGEFATETGDPWWRRWSRPAALVQLMRRGR